MGDTDRIFGIPEIDGPLATALPAGWLAVLTGPSGSGAPLLAKQFANAGVGSVPVLFYTTYERTVDVQKAFEDFGWDPTAIKVVNLADEYYERVLVRGLEVATAREKGIPLSQITAGAPADRTGSAFSLTSRMLSDLATIDTPFASCSTRSISSSKCSLPPTSRRWRGRSGTAARPSAAMPCSRSTRASTTGTSWAPWRTSRTWWST